MTGPAEERVLERFLAAREAKRAARAEKGAAYRTFLVWSGRALEIPLSVMVGMLLGRWIGGYFAHAGAGTLIGTIFGVAAAVRAVVRIVRIVQREDALEQKAQEAANGDA